MEPRLDICAANPRTGFCSKCGVYTSIDPETQERDCPEFSSELQHYDDDGDWDYDPFDAYGQDQY